MTAMCPMCGREHCKVREHFTQATRQETSRSLGLYGYCPSCECSFLVRYPQETLDALARATRDKVASPFFAKAIYR